MAAITSLLRLVVMVAASVRMTQAHGYLAQPPGRSSAWRYGFRTPANYDDNGQNCGGFGVEFGVYNGKCGLCGDPYGGPRRNEPGPDNIYATGTIVANYTQGQSIGIKIVITAAHMGYYEFRLCKNDIPQRGLNAATAAQCDPKSSSFPLLASPGGNTSFEQMDNNPIVLQLPADVTCEACILQWKYKTGNNWGCDNQGCGLGHGNQEEFYGCADIRITPGSVVPTSSTATSQAHSTTTTSGTLSTRTATSPPATSPRSTSTATAATVTAATTTAATTTAATKTAATKTVVTKTATTTTAAVTTAAATTAAATTAAATTAAATTAAATTAAPRTVSTTTIASTSASAVTAGFLVCEPVPPFGGNDITVWCNRNCNWKEHPSCPPTICRCTVA